MAYRWRIFGHVYALKKVNKFLRGQIGLLVDLYSVTPVGVALLSNGGLSQHCQCISANPNVPKIIFQ